MLIPWFQPEISIDDVVGQEGSGSLKARLVDTATESQDEKLFRNELTHLVRKALVNLNEREQYIIRSRFGFQGDERSLEKISAGLNLSRERVRQLECIAKNKLRRYLSCCLPSSIIAGQPGVGVAAR